ncbi:MAG: homoserine O-acetyltransferase [Kiritimatiellae bacterium]|nr:homoserine O-acetyltransferase [Kiritimatiellia bacterium]
MNERRTTTGSVGQVATQTLRMELPPEGFVLEGGQTLPELTVAYETYGRLSPAGDNAVYVCHALTGDAHVAGYHGPDDPKPGWWDEMIGPGKGIDTDYYFVVCANILGGCKGTTGPSSLNPATGKPYGAAFPPITIGDMVNAQYLLLKQLEVNRLAAVVGGSLGGMQVLEWSIRYAGLVDRCICIASAASLSTQALAFDVVGRHAIIADPAWHNGNYYESGSGPAAGLAQARMIGHITYLSPNMMREKFGREKRKEKELFSLLQTDFEVESYLQHQGRKLVSRFDANSYLHITRAMDEFDLRERFDKLENAFEAVQSKFLIVALDADWLFPPEQSMELANALLKNGKHVSYCLLKAPHGHDAFLVDIQHLREAVRAFLPWVKPAAGAVEPAAPAEAAPRSPRPDPPHPESEFGLIRDMIEPHARVLDLGCGEGRLLSMLAAERDTYGFGVDIDIQHVIAVIDRGHDVFQGDLDEGLAVIPDDAYDYAILGQTLHLVKRPRFVLDEMLRVARECIITFPNYSRLADRLRLAFAGRMPRSIGLPGQWYDAPTLHMTTLQDFLTLCTEDGIDVVDMICIPRTRMDRLLIALGLCGLGADRILVKVAKRPHAADDDRTKRPCRPAP